MKSNQRSRKLVALVGSDPTRSEEAREKMASDLMTSTASTTVYYRRHNHKHSLLENSSTTNNDREATKYCAISNTISPTVRSSDNHDRHQITQGRIISTCEKSKSNSRYAMRKRATITRHDRLTSYIRKSTPSVVVVFAASAILLLVPCIFITQTQAFFLSAASSPQNSAASAASSSGDPSDSSSPVASSSLPQSASSDPSPAAAAAAAAIQSLSSSLLSAATGSIQATNGKQNGEKQGSGSNSPAAADSSSASDSAKSVVASLSSAVASAAAAAAVAAAQSSLSGSDGRSLFVKNNQKTSQNHGDRSHIAMKLVDSMPEVPYNILHNMKKVDHAAPFYNSPNKLAGSSKESLLASASSSSSSSSLNDQLGSLFKSPLWKRISDGYGEFASEFRSLFKHTRPTTMKGPASSSLTTSKIIRDISVPALLMLLASAVPSEWRPIRLRRKSIPFLPPPSDPMSLSGSDMIPTYSMAPPMFAASNLNLAPQQQQPQQTSLLGRALNPLAQLYGQLDQVNSQQQQLGTTNPLARAAASPSDINPQANWMPPSPLQQQQQSQQPIRRSGDISRAISSGNQGEGIEKSTHGRVEKLVNDVSSTSSQLFGQNDNDHLLRSENDKEQKPSEGLLSSFTSRLVNQVVGGHTKLMAKLMNANVAGDNLAPVLDLSQYQVASLTDDQSPAVPFYNKIMKRSYHETEADKHRYSIIGTVDQESAKSRSHHHRSANPISAMTQALGSIFTPSLHSVQSGPALAESGSGSSSGKKSLTTNYMHTTNTNNNNKPVSNNNNPNTLISRDEMTNHDLRNHQESMMLRRNQQHTGGDMVMEQRELSQLIPQSWREVVKRTVNNVQQTASTQWRSFEGQITNWVQDKFKGSSTSSTSPSSAGAPSVTDMLAKGSSAVTRILGLGGSANKNSPPASTTESSRNDLSTNPTNSKSKNDAAQPNRSTKQPSAKGTLAGVANMIVSTFTGRPSSSTTSKSKSPTAPTAANDSASSSSNSNTSQQSSSSPTGNSDSASSSMASGTSSTNAAMSLLGA